MVGGAKMTRKAYLFGYVVVSLVYYGFLQRDPKVLVRTFVPVLKEIIGNGDLDTIFLETLFQCLLVAVPLAVLLLAIYFTAPSSGPNYVLEHRLALLLQELNKCNSKFAELERRTRELVEKHTRCEIRLRSSQSALKDALGQLGSTKTELANTESALNKIKNRSFWERLRNTD